MRHDRWLLLAFFVCQGLVVSSSSAGTEKNAEVAASEAHDCGTTALYYLLNATGHPTTFDQVAAALPSPDPLGHSLLELKTASRRLGLSLDGVALHGMKRRLDTPSLIFLRREGHGHYRVVRPVGHTGRLIQILDGFAPPVVVDAIDLSSSAGWAGVALIPSESKWPRWLAAVLFVGSVAVFVLARFSRNRRRPSAPSLDGFPFQVG